jgi:hypothetical protein
LNKLIVITAAFIISGLFIATSVFAKNDKPKNDNEGGFQPITFCHATSSAKNPYNEITTDNEGVFNGHLDHENDIIPAPEGGCPTGEDEEETDVCPNIDEIQEEVPEGYSLVDGQCIEDEVEETDLCPNIDQVQTIIPDGYILVDGQCIKVGVQIVDLCENIPEVQSVVPEGYTAVENQCYPISTDAIPGCTDPTATNYNPQATVNDESCKYEDPKNDDDHHDDDNDDNDDDHNDDNDDDHNDNNDDNNGRGGIVLGASTMRVTRFPNTSSR